MPDTVTRLRKAEIHGIPVQRLDDTVREIRRDSSLARFSFRVRDEWKNGALNRVTVGDFRGAGREHTREQYHAFDVDEPEILLGADRAANPVEHALGALAGCLTTTIAYHAALLGIRIDAISSTCEDDLDLRGFMGLDDSIRSGLSAVRVRFDIEACCSEEEKAALVHVATERSAVLDIFAGTVLLEVELAS